MNQKSTSGSHADVIYAQLKYEIDALILKPDTILKEVELADRFGVSRTPVREALNKLSAEGLLNNVGGRGTLVASVPYPEALQAYEVRDLIEPFAAAQAAKNQRKHHLIAAFLEKTENLSAAGADISPQSREENDRDFHCLIAEMALNPLIGKIVNDMRSKIRRVFYSSTGGDYHYGREEHRKILDAILAGKCKDAEEAMREHLANAKVRITHMRF